MSHDHQGYLRNLGYRGRPAPSRTAGEVHNVKNASKSAPVKALAFYVAKKGARLEDLAVPAKMGIADGGPVRKQPAPKDIVCQ